MTLLEDLEATGCNTDNAITSFNDNKSNFCQSEVEEGNTNFGYVVNYDNNNNNNKNRKNGGNNPTQQQQQQSQVKTMAKLRGLLKLLKGQIVINGPTTMSSSAENNGNTAIINNNVSVFSYHEDILRTTQTDFQKRRKRQRRPQPRFNDSRWCQYDDIQTLSSSLSSYEEIIDKHRFVCFFVIQGRNRTRGRRNNHNHHNNNSTATTSYCSYYCKHTLNLRKIIATEYHDVMSTFVIDTSSGFDRSNFNDLLLPMADNMDDETTNDSNNHKEEQGFFSNNNFCSGTGFAIYPLPPSQPTNNSFLLTTLTVLNVSKTPSVVVIDTTTGRIVSRDVILAIEKNDSHTVVNRWQLGKSGLSFFQQLCAVVTCQSEDYSFCSIQ
mmetsp:Transcript_428/g.495  ORF Transcript_428/g.495 Transcript_428/m.495 type:complete len:380 (+) Transcript_428:125-1264(+)